MMSPISDISTTLSWMLEGYQLSAISYQLKPMPPQAAADC
jgi:hypothetical protein